MQEILSSLIGDSQTITVAGADEFDPDADEADDEVRAFAEREELLQQWATDERFIMKLHDAEEDAVALGDAVYVLGWSETHGRPRLRTYDPGTYFPVLPDTGESDFPNRVHLAWELPDQGDGKKRIRRITFQLGPIMPLTGPDGAPQIAENGLLVLKEGDTFDEDGRVTRQYPWNEDPSDTTCYMTDATWEVDDLKATIDDFSETRATFNGNEDGDLIRNLDLGIDFIPVIHVPNSISEKEHFGQSSLLRVVQLLDEIGGADTDLASAAATTGSPAYAVSGGPGFPAVEEQPSPMFSETFRGWRQGGAGGQKFGPGAVISAPQGKVELLHTADSLKPLIDYRTHLADVLSVNSRIPGAKLGRVKPSEVPSGVALLLSFSPLRSMIEQMRRVRAEKYSLLFKFVQRFFQLGPAPLIAGGTESVYDVQVAFGSYLPADQAGTIADVERLRDAGLISLETALKMLQEAGLPIDDVQEELERLRREDIETGRALPAPPLFGEPEGPTQE